MHAASKDQNHNSLVLAFEHQGYVTKDCHKHGGGFPDFVVGSHGVSVAVGNIEDQVAIAQIIRRALRDSGIAHRIVPGFTMLVEAKYGNNRLTPDEKAWWNTWKGCAIILYDERVVENEFRIE